MLTMEEHPMSPIDMHLDFCELDFFLSSYTCDTFSEATGTLSFTSGKFSRLSNQVEQTYSHLVDVYISGKNLFELLSGGLTS